VPGRIRNPQSRRVNTAFAGIDFACPVPAPWCLGKRAVCERPSLKIFIVEDDRAVRDSLVLLIDQMELEVIAFESAEDFLESTFPGSDDVVLVDLGLPGMSGGELLRRLSGRLNPPRVVVLSGLPQSAVDRDLAGLAASAVLRKPLSADCISSIF